MRITGIKILVKLQSKNIGNKKLCNAIDQLITDLEQFNPATASITEVRKDADCVHSDGFYFFDIHIHRTLILVEYDDEGEATIIWAGSHDDYERTFKNNKLTIEKWLRNKGYIE
ncbi:type II toxin-antitoxin system HigB family toxin [Niabella sp.]|uniref:type II toxin-antitoxin system HigB family toxin n=1 Tax=Niabella sp. TaxID=1962976 RepID=UPI002617D314|nr:type II toxin-antitoxin system HigB family toxin [Niabella sp.]